MSYAEFHVDSVESELGLAIEMMDLFPNMAALAVPLWLGDILERGRRQFHLSDKARGEFIVAPILLACQNLCSSPLSILSGVRLDVDATHGLIGECGFLLSASKPLPGLLAPLIMMVETKQDIETGLWQCLAQMVGARIFNERAKKPVEEVFGCVTDGEIWQFLRLDGHRAEINQRRFYIGDVGSILAAFGSILGRHADASEFAKR